MDRAYAEPLDVRAVAAVAHISPAHFSRCFRSVFGETPHRYLQRRRVERSMFLLRETDRTVTDVCFAVGSPALGPSAEPSGELSAKRRAPIAGGTARSWRRTVSSSPRYALEAALGGQNSRAVLEKPPR